MDYSRQRKFSDAVNACWDLFEFTGCSGERDMISAAMDRLCDAYEAILAREKRERQKENEKMNIYSDIQIQEP